MRAIYMSLCIAVLGIAAACGLAKPAESPSPSDEKPSGDSTDAATSTGDSDASSPPPAVAKVEAPPAPTHTAPPPAATPPPAEEEKVPYDKEAVLIALRRAARGVKANCGAATDEDGKVTGPWGKATVTVKLGHNGHARGTVVPAPYDGKPVGKCIASAFAIVIFPALPRRRHDHRHPCRGRSAGRGSLALRPHASSHDALARARGPAETPSPQPPSSPGKEGGA